MKNLIKALVAFIIGFLLLISPVVVAQTRLGFNLPPGKTKYTVPIELIGNLVVVKVILNNTLPLKFIVDTGIRTAILTDKTFTDLLNINYTRIIPIPGVGGKKLIDAYIASGVSLDISGLKGTGHSLLVLEEDLLQLRNYLGHNIQGILGYELFSRFIVEINYRKKTMTFYEPEAFAKKKISENKKYYAMPITVEDTKPYCMARVVFYDGSEVQARLMLDTGASHALMLHEESSSDIHIPDNKIRSHLGRGLGGDIIGEIARVKLLDLDKFKFEHVITTFPDYQSYGQDYKKIYRNGTLGGGIFSRFKIIFNFMDGFVYMKKNSTYKNPFNYNMSGIIIKAHGLYLNKFEIIEVRENSSARKADIKVGDKVIRINNQPTLNLKLDEINGLFNSKPNRVIRLELSRDGKIIQRKFKLAQII